MTNRVEWESVKSQIILDCPHTVFMTVPLPKIGDVLYCRMCGNWKPVIGRKHSYHMRCMNCQLHRYYGQAKLNMELAAVRHRRGKPEHTVRLMLGKKILLTLGTNPRQLKIPSRDTTDDDHPPF